MRSVDTSFCNCAKCPIAKKCCSRLSHGYEIDAPHLFANEADTICSNTQGKIDNFAYRREDVYGNYFELKTVNGSCIFLASGKCSIYDYRPIDCQLFPFDLRLNGQDVFWILYIDLCHDLGEISKFIINAKAILKNGNLTKNEILSYSKNVSLNMKKNKFIELEKFSFSDL